MNPLTLLAVCSLFALPLGKPLDAERYLERNKAQAKLNGLPASCALGVAIVGKRSPECREQAERWFVAKSTAPTPEDYGVLCYGDWNTALVLFVCFQERYTSLLRVNGIVQGNESFAFEYNPIRPWEHPGGLKSIRQRLGVLPYEGLPSDGCHSIYRSDR